MTVSVRAVRFSLDSSNDCSQFVRIMRELLAEEKFSSEEPELKKLYKLRLHIKLNPSNKYTTCVKFDKF